MLKMNKIAALGVAACLFLGSGCAKKINGYLSNDIYYTVNPFEVQQGVTTVSAPLVLNGSTAPLTVELTALRDSAGNNADSILLKAHSIITYKATITADDTTLAMLDAKLNDSLVQPFNIGTIGGRLEFTAATSSVPTGNYTMDLHVSNVNGARDIKNACTIVIEPLSSPSSTGFWSYRTNDPTGTTQYMRADDDPTYATFDIAYEENPDTTMIVLKFVDKNGVPFNPNAGEVSDWIQASRAAAVFPTLKDWAPYYTPVYTDSTIVTPLPNIPVSFPYFDLNATYPATGGCRIDNKIKGVASGDVIHTVMYFTLATTGIYYITYHLTADTHS